MFHKLLKTILDWRSCISTYFS